MNAAPFAFGLLLGGVVAFGVGYVLSPASTDESAPLGSQSGPDLDDANLATDDPELARRLRELLAENERLRERLGARQEVDDSGTTEASGERGDSAGPREATSNVALGKPGAHFDELFAELELQLRSGALAKIYAENPNGLMSMLLDNWINASRPEDALALLQRFDIAEEFNRYSERIGEQLFAKGDRDRAREAFLLALQGGNRDWDVIGKLLQLDPAEALRQMDALQLDGEDKGVAVQRALLAIRGGQKEAGLAAFKALAAEGSVNNSAWRALVQSSPELAEAELRARLEAAGEQLDSDDRNFLHTQLAESLRAQGDARAAADHLVAQLDANPDDLSLINSLGSSDRGRAIAWLRARVGTNPTPGAYGALARQLERAKQNGEAVNAYWQAIDLAANDRRNRNNYLERLARLDAPNSASRIADFAGRDNNDELFGDLADGLWRAGRTAEAYRYWRRAHEIDDDDSEWTRKLKAVDEGRDPL